MLTAIKSFFNQHLEPEINAELSESQKRLACAALMVEVATIDEHFDSSEFGALKSHLQEQFQLSTTEIDELAALASSESDDSHSLYQFTRLINDQCTPNDKFELVKGMWRVARADGHIDKYEEYMIRKVSDLIHLSHSEFIRAKKMSQ